MVIQKVTRLGKHSGPEMVTHLGQSWEKWRVIHSGLSWGHQTGHCWVPGLELPKEQHSARYWVKY